MPLVMSRMLDISEPRWKCRSLRQSRESRFFSSSTRARTWLASSPNLAFSPPESCHLPDPCDAKRTRKPKIGRTPSRLPSSRAIASSEIFSTTIKTLCPMRSPFRAMRTYSRSLYPLHVITVFVRPACARTAINSALEPASRPTGSPAEVKASITRRDWLTLMGKTKK